MREVEATNSEKLPLLPSVGNDNAAAPMLQFMEPICVVSSAEDGGVLGTVMRIGSLQGESRVRYKTVEASAKIGKQYVHTEGELIFEQGVDEAVFHVPVLNDPDWNAVKEFRVMLYDERGCRLERYLKEMRVKVFDVDVFPNADFTEKIEAGKLEEVNLWALFFGFNKLMLHQEGVKLRTILTILTGFFKNAYEYMLLILQIYTVDVIFNFHTEEGLLVPGSRLHTAYVVALLIFVPKLLLFLADHAEVQMDLAGLLRMQLSQNLFRTFMNYSAPSRDEVCLPEMILSLTADVGEVSFGFIRGLGMIRLLGQIGIAIFFTLQHNPGCWWAIVAVPAVMSLWGLMRVSMTIQASDDSGESMNDLTMFVNETLSKVGFIGDYKQRPQINELFEERTKSFKAVRIPEKRVNVNNMSVPKLMGPLMTASYTAIGAAVVLSGSLKLGTYLATIRAFGNICSDFVEFYGLVMEIIGTFPALRGLTDLFNKQMEMPSLKQTNEQRVRITHDKRISIKKDGTPRIDKLPIAFIDVSFGYPEKGTGNVVDTIFKGVNFETPQGKIVVVLSKSGAGRRTFLELMSGRLYPTSGVVFIPSYLRTLLVTRDIVLLNLSVWANLTFGDRVHCDPFRIEKILQYFGMDAVLAKCQKDLEKAKKKFRQSLSDDLLELHKAAFPGDLAATDEHAEDEEFLLEEAHEKIQKSNDMEGLAETQRALLHLSRGFILNPEVLMVHRPFSHFHDYNIFDKVESALISARDDRGFMTSGDLHAAGKRPRSFFITPDLRKETILKVADLIWFLPNRADIQAGHMSYATYKTYDDIPKSERLSMPTADKEILRLRHERRHSKEFHQAHPLLANPRAEDTLLGSPLGSPRPSPPVTTANGGAETLLASGMSSLPLSSDGKLFPEDHWQWYNPSLSKVAAEGANRAVYKAPLDSNRLSPRTPFAMLPPSMSPPEVARWNI